MGRCMDQVEGVIKVGSAQNGHVNQLSIIAIGMDETMEKERKLEMAVFRGWQCSERKM